MFVAQMPCHFSKRSGMSLSKNAIVKLTVLFFTMQYAREFYGHRYTVLSHDDKPSSNVPVGANL